MARGLEYLHYYYPKPTNGFDCEFGYGFLDILLNVFTDDDVVSNLCLAYESFIS